MNSVIIVLEKFRCRRILAGAIAYLGAILMSVLASSADAEPPPPLPNIVVIYADDLGYGDVQCYNPERGKIPTPHIDRLAQQGVRFTDAHSSSGVCSPSRYTLLTGRYHWRTRLQSGIVGKWGAPLIAPDRLTIAGLARQAGYRTACIGKWHLGWDWPIEEADRTYLAPREKPDATATPEHQAAWQRVFSQRISGGPTARGFDHYFGTDVPNWPPYCFINDDHTIGIPSEFLSARLLGNNQASLQGPALPGWTLEPILPALGEHAAEFIQDNSANATPFLIYMPLTAPHTPLAVNESWKGKSGLGMYADFVMETDSVVGRVLQALRQSGAEERTLVLFTSDNGCAPYIGVDDLERQGHFPSGPLRGYKSDVWEGGHRVPFIVRWPGVALPGRVCDQLVHQADLLATLADLFDLALTGNAGEDSFSTLPLLKGEDRAIRTSAVSQSSRGLLSVRQGRWKLIFGRGSGGWGKGEDEHAAQLYDLDADLAESDNLFAVRPEIVSKLNRAMNQIVHNGRSTPGPAQANDVPVRWKSIETDTRTSQN